MALNLSTIDYDLPITNLIAGLNATGHITHRKYKKAGVTFHHNGGRLSHQGVLDVWKVRPASAQFDSDAFGNIAQYANAFEYAWACGNTRGNQVSISIEMCNSKLAPTWEVAEVTWQGAARLAAFLFSSGIIAPAPDPKKNLWVHHDWLSTACAGPYMDKVRGQLNEAVMDFHATFKRGGHVPAPPPVKPKPAPVKSGKPGKPGELKVDGVFGNASTAALFYLAGVDDSSLAITGQARTIRTSTAVGKALDVCWPTLAYGSGGSLSIAWLQRQAGVIGDGQWGPVSRKACQRMWGVDADGTPGYDTTKAAQRWINTQLKK